MSWPCRIVLPSVVRLHSRRQTHRARRRSILHAYMYSLPTPLTQYALLSILMWNSSLNLNFYSSAFLRLSVAEWLACWTQTRRRRAWVQIVVATLAGNSLRQTVRTHRVSVHQAAKLVAALLRVVRVTAGLVESNGSLPPGL